MSDPYFLATQEAILNFTLELKTFFSAEINSKLSTLCEQISVRKHVLYS